MKHNTDEAELQAQLRAKFDEIGAFLAADLGYGDMKQLTPEQRVILNAETEDAIDAWSLAEVDSEPPAWLEANTPLQRLLAEYREIEERILDLRDEAWVWGMSSGPSLTREGRALQPSASFPILGNLQAP